MGAPIVRPTCDILCDIAPKCATALPMFHPDDGAGPYLRGVAIAEPMPVEVIEALMQPGTLRDVDPAELLAGLLRRPAWHAEAACRGDGVERFVPRFGIGQRRAQATCSECEARSECLAFALERPELVGVWGGTTANERKRLRERR